MRTAAENCCRFLCQEIIKRGRSGQSQVDRPVPLSIMKNKHSGREERQVCVTVLQGTSIAAIEMKKEVGC